MRCEMRLTDEFMQRYSLLVRYPANEEYSIHRTGGVSGDTTHRLLLHIHITIHDFYFFPPCLHYSAIYHVLILVWSWTSVYEILWRVGGAALVFLC